MNNQGGTRLEFLVNLFNNLFHKKNLIILLGKDGTTISALNRHKIIDTIFILNEAKDFLQKYRNFLIKYKKYHVIFLIDDINTTLRHEVMAVIDSIVKNNPVESFIEKNFAPEDIVAYNVYETTSNDGEMWNSCIASTPFVFPIENMVKYVINNSLKYSGMYFFNLECEVIIERILQKTDNKKHLKDLQIFVVTTKSSQIRIIVKYKKNIMDDTCLEYPEGKSNLYLKGMIEQAISDKLLRYDSFIKKRQLNVCIITLSNQEFQKVLSNLKLDDCTTIALSGKQISNCQKREETLYQDNSLLEIYDNHNTHLAFNDPLRLITKLSLFNSIIFKPVLAIIFVLSITLSSIKYRSIVISNQTNEYTKEYYDISEKYRQAQKKYPDLKNANNLMEFYNLEKLISKTAITPFDHINTIFAFDSPYLKIKQMKWGVDNPTAINLQDNQVTINVKYQYEGDAEKILDGIEVVNGYYRIIDSSFDGYKITYKRSSDDIVEIAKKVIIPAEITLQGKVNIDDKAGKDVR